MNEFPSDRSTNPETATLAKAEKKRKTSPRIKPALMFAKLPDFLFRTPGLFRSVRRGYRGEPLDVTFISAGLRYRFMGQESLGVDDLRVLLGLLAFAGRQNNSFDMDASMLAPKEKAQTLLSRKVPVTVGYNQLARELGYEATGGGADITIRAAIDRFQTVTVMLSWEERGQVIEHPGSPLLELNHSVSLPGSLSVLLNPLLSHAVLGAAGNYYRFDLDEARKLKTDVARLLHMKLSWIRGGEEKRVGMEKLLTYVYGGSIAEGSTLRTRRTAVAAGMNQIAELLGWIISQEDGIFEVKRKGERSKKRAAFLDEDI